MRRFLIFAAAGLSLLMYFIDSTAVAVAFGFLQGIGGASFLPTAASIVSDQNLPIGIELLLALSGQRTPLPRL